MMNFWISDQPENDWNTGFDGGQNMPWYARYDYIEYWEYVPEDQWDDTVNFNHPFKQTWKDDFNTFDESRWFTKNNWTFPGNQCTFMDS